MYKLAFGPCVFTFSHVVQVAFFPNDTYFDLYARKCRRKGHRIKIFKGKKKACERILHVFTGNSDSD